jgi:hypothetical protein
MADPTVPRRHDAEQVSVLLDSPEITRLITDLEATRWTGRPGYPIRAMVGMALTKSLYALPTWTRTAALVRDHAALRAALGCADTDSPSVYACYRFPLAYAGRSGTRWSPARRTAGRSCTASGRV